CRPRSEPAELAAGSAAGGRTNAGYDAARWGAGPTAMPDHRGRPGGSERANTVFPEGVLPQRLHQEPEATGALIQYTRLSAKPEREYNLCVPCHVRSLPAGNRGKGDMLAA